MKCMSKKCMYFFDECIRKNIVIIDGKCPYYNEHQLVASNVFMHPVINIWEIHNKSYEGHILDVLAYVNANEPVNVQLSTHDHGETAVYTQPPHDIITYLPFIDTNIYAMYLESFLYDYFVGSMYNIDFIDCTGVYVHVKLSEKG